MNVYEYTALNNRLGANAVVQDYGMQPANTPQELAQQLAHCVNQGGENALMKVASVHPDVDLFQQGIDNIKKGYEEDKKTLEQQMFFRADGQSIKNEVSEIRSAISGNDQKGTSTKDLLVIGIIGIAALAIIMKK